MTVYVLSWENSDMETMVFSSFEKANSVAKFILNHLPSGKIAWEEQDEDSIVYHLDYQNDEDVNEDFDDDDFADFAEEEAVGIIDTDAESVDVE